MKSYNFSDDVEFYSEKEPPSDWEDYELAMNDAYERDKNSWPEEPDIDTIISLEKELLGKNPPSDSLTDKDRKEIIEGIFLNAPEGDFKWEQDIGGDDYAWSCGDSECKTQWHTTCYITNIGRTKGKRYIEILYMSYGDGDWQLDLYWEDGYDITEMANWLADGMYNYFKGWAEYWIDCYKTGNDPLGEILDIKRFSPNFCLKAAQENIDYM